MVGSHPKQSQDQEHETLLQDGKAKAMSVVLLYPRRGNEGSATQSGTENDTEEATLPTTSTNDGEENEEDWETRAEYDDFLINKDKKSIPETQGNNAEDEDDVPGTVYKNKKGGREDETSEDLVSDWETSADESEKNKYEDEDETPGNNAEDEDDVQGNKNQKSGREDEPFTYQMALLGKRN